MVRIVQFASAVNAVSALSFATDPKTRLPSAVVVTEQLYAVEEDPIAGEPATRALSRTSTWSSPPPNVALFVVVAVT